MQSGLSLPLLFRVLFLGSSKSPGNKMRHINDAGLGIIREFESFRSRAYKAIPTEKYWTVGYGHYGPDVSECAVLNKTEAEALLRKDVEERESVVFKTVPMEINDNRFSACVSLVYNIGCGNWAKSKVLKHILDGNMGLASEAFMNHVYGSGKKLPGLVRRRTAERKLFDKAPC